MKKNLNPPKATSRVPAPAHPHRRREPLPWHRPKASDEDPDAPRRIQAILDSPSYLQADLDVSFLNLDETRGVRLQIDYLKPEMLLEQHGIQHTIVVFGSTRITEPDAAQRRVEGLQAELDADPSDVELQRRPAHPGQEPLLRRCPRLWPAGEQGRHRARWRAAGGHDRRRPRDDGGSKPRRL